MRASRPSTFLPAGTPKSEKPLRFCAAAFFRQLHSLSRARVKVQRSVQTSVRVSIRFGGRIFLAAGGKQDRRDKNGNNCAYNDEW
jgi:hypothetical protein